MNLVTTDSEIYGAVERGTALDVAAVNLADGKIRWTTTLADAGTWSEDFNLATTSAGVMTSYADDAGNGHLTVLDRLTGRKMWDTPLEGAAYELFNESADGIGGVMTDEDTASFVNLQTGALKTDTNLGDTAVIVDGHLVVQDGSTLRMGIDPFNPSAKVTQIPLPSGAPTTAWAKTDKLLMIGAADGSVSAFVDGKPRWSIDVQLPDIQDVEAVGDHVLVVSSSSESPEGNWSQYFWVDEQRASPIAGVPAGFKPRDSGVLGDTAVVVGDGVDGGVVLAVGQDGITKRGAFDAVGAESIDILGKYVALGDAGQFRVVALDGLKQIAEVPKPPPRPFATHSLFRIGDDYIATAEGDHIAVYH